MVVAIADWLWDNGGTNIGEDAAQVARHGPRAVAAVGAVVLGLLLADDAEDLEVGEDRRLLLNDLHYDGLYAPRSCRLS